MSDVQHNRLKWAVRNYLNVYERWETVGVTAGEDDYWRNEMRFALIGEEDE
ncbi:MAG TPA: hypothetical protein VIG24_19505 [Acidimicrobiia bacterium]